MKKLIIALIAAAMALTAVSCEKSGKTQKKSAEETQTKNMSEYEAEKRGSMKERAIDEAFEKADMTAQQIEKYDIPDDWKELSFRGISMCVPPDVEASEGFTGSEEYRNPSGTVHIIPWAGYTWDEGFGGDEDFPEITDEKVRNAFSELGIGYDGTRLSFYRAVLALTGSSRTDENADAFETAVLAKGIEFSNVAEVFVTESDGHPIYINGLYNEAEMEEEDTEKYRTSFSASIFADENTEYTVMIFAGSMSEALKMASSIKII